MYLSCELAHTRVIGLETFWNESLWVEIKVNRAIYLIGLFCSPRTADPIFFDSLTQNIEKALDITNNIIILGDMNEDLLNPNVHNSNDVLLLNSLENFISEPTSQLALLDPIIVHAAISPLSQGIIQVPNEISDHCATYVHIPFEYPLHGTFTRNVWTYKDATYTSDTEAAFLDLHLSISNGIVSTKIYDKRDDFDFEIVNFPFLDGDVPRSASYGVYISQLIRFDALIS